MTRRLPTVLVIGLLALVLGGAALAQVGGGPSDPRPAGRQQSFDCAGAPLAHLSVQPDGTGGVRTALAAARAFVQERRLDVDANSADTQYVTSDGARSQQPSGRASTTFNGRSRSVLTTEVITEQAGGRWFVTEATTCGVVVETNGSQVAPPGGAPDGPEEG